MIAKVFVEELSNALSLLCDPTYAIATNGLDLIFQEHCHPNSYQCNKLDNIHTHKHNIVAS